MLAVCEGEFVGSRKSSQTVVSLCSARKRIFFAVVDSTVPHPKSRSSPNQEFCFVRVAVYSKDSAQHL